MADTHSKETRSYNMSRIKSRDTKPEMLVRKYLFSRGLRFRKNDKRYPGHPDLVLPKYKTVVFVHGCFWHIHDGHPCFVFPKSRLEYWSRKLERNKQRDVDNLTRLTKDGWSVIVVWECELSKANRDERLQLLYQQIVG